MLERGRALLAQGRSVLLDATFGRSTSARRRERWRTRWAPACLRGVPGGGSDDPPSAEPNACAPAATSSDARPEIHQAQVQVFEPVTELPAHEHIALDCGRPLGQCVLDARRLVDERLAPPA